MPATCISSLFAPLLIAVLLSCDARTARPAATPIAAADSVSVVIADSVSAASAQGVERFLAKHPAYNQQTFFFINMRLPAHAYRFFVYDLEKKQIVHRGLVAQGINTRPDAQGRLRFSNETGSYCTSLGRYRIGKKYKGRFGTAYKLYGLDSSNSNAYRRAIVLHKYDDMPETPGGDIFYSLGCPMVPARFFTTLSRLIDQSEAPVLLQISY
ncbi:MAG: murein L,D-transpeptidase catalytic domain family protein [Flavihumibacter sp.]